MASVLQKEAQSTTLVASKTVPVFFCMIDNMLARDVTNMVRACLRKVFRGKSSRGAFFLVFVVIVLSLMIGPPLRLNFLSECYDIQLGRMVFEPEVPEKLDLSDWTSETAKAQWLACTTTPCRYISSDTSTRIPKRIHQMYKGEEVPEVYRKYIDSWRRYNPDYEYWFWTNADIEQFMSDHYPRYLPLYRSYHYNIQRSDVARYFILHKFGGVHVDLDYESLRPLNGYLRNHSCVLSHEPQVQSMLLYQEDVLITNAFMSSIPQHPLFLLAMQTLEVAKRLTEQRRGRLLMLLDSRWTIYLTGPMLFSRVYEQYMEKTCCQQVDNFKVYLAPAEKLAPMADEQKMTYFREVCARARSGGADLPHDILLKQRAVCKRLHDTDFHQVLPRDAYARHDWLHIGYHGNKDRLRQVPITDIVRSDQMVRYMRDVRHREGPIEVHTRTISNREI